MSTVMQKMSGRLPMKSAIAAHLTYKPRVPAGVTSRLGEISSHLFIQCRQRLKQSSTLRFFGSFNNNNKKDGDDTDLPKETKHPGEQAKENSPLKRFLENSPSDLDSSFNYEGLYYRSPPTPPKHTKRSYRKRHARSLQGADAGVGFGGPAESPNNNTPSPKIKQKQHHSQPQDYNYRHHSSGRRTRPSANSKQPALANHAASPLPHTTMKSSPSLKKENKKQEQSALLTTPQKVNRRSSPVKKQEQSALLTTPEKVNRRSSPVKKQEQSALFTTPEKVNRRSSPVKKQEQSALLTTPQKVNRRSSPVKKQEQSALLTTPQEVNRRSSPVKKTPANVVESPLPSKKIAVLSTPERHQRGDDEEIFQTSPGKSTSPGLGNILNSLRRSSLESPDNSSGSPRIEKYTPKITLGKYTQYSPRGIDDPLAKSTDEINGSSTTNTVVNGESKNDNNTYNKMLYVPELMSVLGQSPRYKMGQSPRYNSGGSETGDCWEWDGMICETFQGTTTPQHTASFHEIDVEKWVSSDELCSPDGVEEVGENTRDVDLSIEEESFSPKSSSSPEPSRSSFEAEELNLPSDLDDLGELSNNNNKRGGSSISATLSPSAALGTEVYRLYLPDSPRTTAAADSNNNNSRQLTDEAKDLPLALPRRAAIGGDPGVSSDNIPVRHRVRRKQRYTFNKDEN